MPVPSAIVASLSPALRRLEAAAARAPELTLEQEAALSPLVAETVEKLDELAARLERARTPRDGSAVRDGYLRLRPRVGATLVPPTILLTMKTTTKEEIMKRHIATIIVVALSIAMFLALSGTALAAGRIRLG